MQIVNCSARGQTKQANKAQAALLQLLRKLKHKHPGDYRIDATLADYVRSKAQRLNLYRYAYTVARLHRDRANMAIIASDLADRYWESRELRQAALWLARAKKHLKRLDESYAEDKVKHVSIELQKLRERRRQLSSREALAAVG